MTPEQFYYHEKILRGPISYPDVIFRDGEKPKTPEQEYLSDKFRDTKVIRTRSS